MRKIWMAAAMALLASVGIGAQRAARTPVDVDKLGPQVGERVPEFSLPDQAGTTQTLRSVMGPQGALVVFYRSADW